MLSFSTLVDKKGATLVNPPGTREDGHFSFGFGRRVCVGKHVAGNSQKLPLDGCVDEGAVVSPKPFAVNIQPRFPEALAVLTQERELHGR
ncbi:unnamed protein product [Peniophora sp. CBMAI 1063]|nr:unnamed protein product [Peniophora sp. CBMAI 1063]